MYHREKCISRSWEGWLRSLCEYKLKTPLLSFHTTTTHTYPHTCTPPHPLHTHCLHIHTCTIHTYTQGVLKNYDDIVTAAGTGGTACGLAIGNYLTGTKVRVHPILSLASHSDTNFLSGETERERNSQHLGSI